ncbi:MAG: hypothetical protein U0M06_07135 [Clostridia bacterium]|nr:hypothetical protein [Clostridia bacterium]
MSEKNISKKIRKPNEKRISAFGRGAAVYAASVAAVIAVLLCFLAAFLYTYESNLPEKTAQKFSESLAGEKLAALIEETLGVDSLSPFENGENIISRSEFLSGEIKQTKFAKEYTSAAPVFRLLCGENDIGRLTLKKAKKNAAFGLTRWEIDKVSLYDEAVPGTKERIQVKVTLPQGASLRVNGIEAGEKYLTEKNAEYKGKAVGLSGVLCDIYSIENLCLVPSLTVTYNGEESVLSCEGGKGDYFTDKTRSFTLTAPSNASVSIMGKAPDPALAVKGSLTEAVTEFEKELGDLLPSTLSYTVFGDTDMDICVEVNGEKLEGELFDGENGERKLIFLNSDSSKFRASAVLPEGAVLYINGVRAGEEYCKGEAEFSSLSSVAYLFPGKKAPVGVLYEINGLLTEPSVSARLGEEELVISSLSREKQTTRAEFYGGSDEALDDIKKSADLFARAYFHYVANGAVGIEENYAALISAMKSGSPGYKQIKKSKSSFEFVNRGVYKINKIETLGTASLGGGIYFCKLDFSVDLRYYRNEKLYEGTLSLVFIKEGESILVCDMQIDSAS